LIVRRRVNGIFETGLEFLNSTGWTDEGFGAGFLAAKKLGLSFGSAGYYFSKSVMTQNPHRRLKGVAIKLLVSGVTTILCLFALELGVRLLFPYYKPESQIPFIKNSDGVVTGAPGQVARQRTPKGDFNLEIKFNRHGFRDAKDTAAGGSNNIFVAGDSFSIGWGVDGHELYSSVMEKELRMPVYNIAAPEDIRGYLATVNYAKKIGAKVQHLVIGLCMENDVWDYSQPISPHALYAEQMNPGRMRAVYNWFKRHSALWICTSHQIQRSQAGRALFEKLGIAKNIEALTHKNEYSPQILSTTRDELLKLTQAYNSVVLIIPSRGLWHGKNVAIEEKIHVELLGLLRAAGVRVVDMRPVFEKAGRPLAFYFSNDPHWNAAGHKLAGEELSRYLRTLPEWQNVLAN
jgi:hypothetical protein